MDTQKKRKKQTGIQVIQPNVCKMLVWRREEPLLRTGIHNRNVGYLGYLETLLETLGAPPPPPAPVTVTFRRLWGMRLGGPTRLKGGTGRENPADDDRGKRHETDTQKRRSRHVTHTRKRVRSKGGLVISCEPVKVSAHGSLRVTPQSRLSVMPISRRRGCPRPRRRLPGLKTLRRVSDSPALGLCRELPFRDRPARPLQRPT